MGGGGGATGLYSFTEKPFQPNSERERQEGVRETRREEGEGATDAAEDRMEETQTDKDERRSSVGYAGPDS